MKIITMIMYGDKWHPHVVLIWESWVNDISYPLCGLKFIVDLLFDKAHTKETTTLMDKDIIREVITDFSPSSSYGF